MCVSTVTAMELIFGAEKSAGDRVLARKTGGTGLRITIEDMPN